MATFSGRAASRSWAVADLFRLIQIFARNRKFESGLLQRGVCEPFRFQFYGIEPATQLLG
jgi:hypothetical protein